MSGVVNSGTFDRASVSGTLFSSSTPQYSYCQEGSVTGTTYPTPGSGNANEHIFGFRANGIIVSNEGSVDLCYAFPIVYGKLNGSQVDSGIIKAGQTVLLPYLSGHPGIMFRGRAAGTINYVISAY